MLWQRVGRLIVSFVASFAAVCRLTQRYCRRLPCVSTAIATLIVSCPVSAQKYDQIGELIERSIALRQQGQSTESRSIAERALEQSQARLGNRHPMTGAALEQIALSHIWDGNYELAEKFYKRSLSIYEQALGQDHPAVGAVLNGLGSTLDNLGRYADAEQPLRRSIVIREKAFGPDHPQVTTPLMNLAGIYHRQG